MKILIVDDDPLVLESCRRILAAPPYTVHLTSGADQALDVLARMPGLDLVITDIKMPGKDGIFLARQIQELYPDLPVLIMTGYLMDEVRQMEQPGKRLWFLAKPFTPAELAAGVTKALGPTP